MGSIEFTSEIRQSSSNNAGFLWEVSVIGEGPGLNSQVGNDGQLYREYFTRESIHDLTGKLDGVKVKAFRFQEGTRKEKRNHLPPEIDNAIGHKFTGNNVGVLEKPRHVDVHGKLHAFADMRLSEHDQARWLKDMLLWAHNNGHPDYVGLSINSTGLTRQRVVESTQQRFMDVIQINRPKSVEIVDTPAARGEVKAQFVRLIQGYISEDANAMNEETKTTDEITQEKSQSTEEDTNLVEETSSEETTTEETVTESPEEDASQETPDEEKEKEEKKEEDETEEGTVVESEEASETENESSPIDTLIVEAFRRHVYNPLTEYLDTKGVIYSGNTITTIVESLDFSGVSKIDESALRALSAYENEGKINAARQLIEELSTVDNTQKDVDISTQEDSVSDESTEDDRIVLQEESSNAHIDDETMANEEVKTTEVVEEVSEESKEIVEEKEASTETEIQESTEETKEEETQEENTEATPEPTSDPDMLTKLTESLSKFTEEQSKKADLMEQQLTLLREENEKLRKTEDTRDEMVAALAEFRGIQEQERMDRVLRESGLYPEVIDEIREELDGKVVTSDQLGKIIERKKRLLARIQESSPSVRAGNVRGIGWSNLRMGASAPDKFQAAMNRLFDVKAEGTSEEEAYKDPGLRFSTLRQGYSEITGDVNVDGIMNQRYIREGVIGHDTFEKTLSNTMNRYLVQWYDTFEQEWRRIIRIRQGVRDFKAQEMNRVGGFGNLKVFTDTMQNPSPTGYAEATPPVEQAGSFKPVIRAKMFTITEQMIKNDDLFVITRMLEESARAADETLMTFVFSLLIGGSHYLETSNAEFVPSAQINSDDVYSGADLRKLYATDNSGTTAFDYWPLLNAINGMKRMRKIGNDKPLKLAGKKYLVLPYELENTALRIHPMNTDQEPGGQDNDANILPKDLEIIAIDRMYLGDDANNWYLVEDPMRWEGIQVGFVDGEENPRIVLANNPTAGRTFSHGGLQYTVSHRYGGGIAGHEGLYASFVA